MKGDHQGEVYEIHPVRAVRDVAPQRVAAGEMAVAQAQEAQQHEPGDGCIEEPDDQPGEQVRLVLRFQNQMDGGKDEQRTAEDHVEERGNAGEPKLLPLSPAPLHLPPGSQEKGT